MPSARHRSVGLILAIAVVLGAACTTRVIRPSTRRQSQPKQVPTCKDVPVKAKFKYAGGVLGTDRAFVRKVARQAISYYRIRTVDCVKREPVDVHFYAKDRGKLLALAAYGDIQVFTKSKAWRLAPAALRAQVLFHEWYHVLQKTLTVAPPPPVWLIEGSAEWAGFESSVHFHYIPSMSLVREAVARDARQATRPLTKTNPSAPGAYSLYFTGVDYLLKNHGGKKYLREFWKRHRPSRPWKKTFRSVFGIEANSFLKKYAAYRASGFVD
jgi:hypothetical protein